MIKVDIKSPLLSAALLLLASFGFCSSASAQSQNQALQWCQQEAAAFNPSGEFEIVNYCALTINSSGGVFNLGYIDHGDTGDYPHNFGYSFFASSPAAAVAKNLGSSDCHCGDPIAPGIGNKYEIKQEYRGSGPFPLEFSWTYNSNELGLVTTPQGLVLGNNRTHNYARSIQVLSDGTTNFAYASRPDGNVEIYTQSGSSWVAGGDNLSKLVTLVDGQGATTGWQRTDANSGEVEQYRADGRLILLTNRDGFTQSLAYDGSGRLQSVQDSFGRALIFSYNASNQLNRLDLPDGQHLEFTYDSTWLYAANLTSVRYPDASTISYAYNETGYVAVTDDPHALTGVIDEKGNRHSSTTYDSAHRAAGTVLAGGVDSFSAAYQSAPDGSYAQTATVTDPLGATETLSFSPILGRVHLNATTISCSGCVTKSSSQTYDAQGRPDISTDYAGTTTDSDYDAVTGLLTQKVESKNNASTKRTIQTDWNTTLRVPTERRVYDSSASQPGVLKAREQWTYNTRGQVLTHVRIDANNASVTRTTTYTYCENAATCGLVGLIMSIDGERTDVVDTTNFTYYTADDPTCASAPTTCPHRKGDLWKATNAKGQVTTYLKYDGAGRPLQVSDANGVVTDLSYSPRGWLTQAAVRGADPNSTGDDAITTIEYDATGMVNKVTQPDGDYLQYSYDTAHRLTKVVDKLANSVNYTLDAAGNRTKTETNDPGPNYTLRRTMSQVFDQFGRLKTLLNAAGQATAITYDINDNLVQTTDALSHKTGQTVDVLGRVTQITQDVGGLAVPTLEQYNALDQVTQVTDPKGLNTAYTYNGFGDLITLASPDTGSSSDTVNAAGQRVTQTDARGITLTDGYDALNRLTSVTGPTPAQNFTYTYDTVPTDCVTGETYGLGRLGQISDESGSTRYCYDRFGNLTRQVQTIGTATETTRYEYTLAGRLYRVTYPSGAQALYARNADGQVNNVQLTISGVTNTLVSSVSYLPFGPLNSLTFGNNRVLTKAFDADYGIDKVSDNAATNPLSEDYSLDAVGNVTGVTEQLTASGSTTRTYSYDALDRITAHKNGASTVEGFAYNGTGDRTSKTVGTTQNYTYGATNHWLTNVSGVSARGYDAAGNTANFGTAYVFGYDDHARLRTFTLNGTLVRTYTYNALGQRVQRVVNNAPSQSEQFVYDQAGHLLGEYTTSGTRIAEYVWLDDTLVGIIKAAEGSTYQFVETDALGTPRAVINPTNNTIIWRWDITPTAFGDHNPINDPDGNGTTYTLGLRYPGQFNDGLDFINYNGFRDYYANSGRYLESDPIGLGGGISTYGYVGGNPLGYFDPQGLAPNQACVAAYTATCAAIGGGLGFYGGGLAGGFVGSGVPVAGTAAGAIGGAELGGIGGASAGGLAGNALGNAVCPDDECAKLEQQINSLVSELKKRSSELIRDPRGLPLSGPMSIAGHQQQFRNKQARLRRLLGEADSKGCKSYTSDAWTWATLPAPSPGWGGA
jgi:RHS repeat-associated protein